MVRWRGGARLRIAGHGGDRKSKSSVTTLNDLGISSRGRSIGNATLLVPEGLKTSAQEDLSPVLEHAQATNLGLCCQELNPSTIANLTDYPTNRDSEQNVVVNNCMTGSALSGDASTERLLQE